LSLSFLSSSFNSIFFKTWRMFYGKLFSFNLKLYNSILSNPPPFKSKMKWDSMQVFQKTWSPFSVFLSPVVLTYSYTRDSKLEKIRKKAGWLSDSLSSSSSLLKITNGEWNQTYFLSNVFICSRVSWWVDRDRKEKEFSCLFVLVLVILFLFHCCSQLLLLLLFSS